MSEITFEAQKRAEIIAKLQRYCDRELEFELGQFDGDFLLDFITKELGPYFYNQGIQDAQVVVNERLESIQDALYEIEKVYPKGR